MVYEATSAFPGKFKENGITLGDIDFVRYIMCILWEAFTILRIDDMIASKSSGTNRAGGPGDKLDGDMDGKDFD